jgi:hypothetical protein
LTALSSTLALENDCELHSDLMKNVRVVTWNCAGAFRRKWLLLAELRADLAVIQECEDPAMAQDEASREWATGHTWAGPRSPLAD